MTAFFNKKEEVIDIELTPYGESLLSIGEFKPTYYAFFDNDILYDASGSASIQETQNDVESRIQDTTPSLKVQATYSGIQSGLAPLIESARLSSMITGAPDRTYDAIPANVDQNFTFIEPMGTMEAGSQNAPAWNIKALKGELTGAINYLTSSVDSGVYNNVKRIPQLDFELTYRVLIGNISNLNPFGDLAREGRVISQVYEDGTFLYLSKQSPAIILVIDEENTAIDLDYDMEVFLMEDPVISSAEPPTLMPKKFLRQQYQVVDDILVDNDPTPQNTMLDESYAEYFFLLNADMDIPSEDICPVLGDTKVRGITLNDIPYDCQDVESFGRYDIYGTNAAEEDPCDD